MRIGWMQEEVRIGTGNRREESQIGAAPVSSMIASRDAIRVAAQLLPETAKLAIAKSLFR